MHRGVGTCSGRASANACPATGLARALEANTQAVADGTPGPDASSWQNSRKVEQQHSPTATPPAGYFTAATAAASTAGEASLSHKPCVRRSHTWASSADYDNDSEPHLATQQQQQQQCSLVPALQHSTVPSQELNNSSAVHILTAAKQQSHTHSPLSQPPTSSLVLHPNSLTSHRSLLPSPPLALLTPLAHLAGKSYPSSKHSPKLLAAALAAHSLRQQLQQYQPVSPQVTRPGLASKPWLTAVQPLPSFKAGPLGVMLARSHRLPVVTQDVATAAGGPEIGSGAVAPGAAEEGPQTTAAAVLALLLDNQQHSDEPPGQQEELEPAAAAESLPATPCASPMPAAAASATSDPADRFSMLLLAVQHARQQHRQQQEVEKATAVVKRSLTTGSVPQGLSAPQGLVPPSMSSPAIHHHGSTAPAGSSTVSSTPVIPVRRSGELCDEFRELAAAVMRARRLRLGRYGSSSSVRGRGKGVPMTTRAAAAAAVGSSKVTGTSTAAAVGSKRPPESDSDLVAGWSSGSSSGARKRVKVAGSVDTAQAATAADVDTDIDMSPAGDVVRRSTTNMAFDALMDLLGDGDMAGVSTKPSWMDTDMLTEHITAAPPVAEPTLTDAAAAVAALPDTATLVARRLSSFSRNLLTLVNSRPSSPVTADAAAPSEPPAPAAPAADTPKVTPAAAAAAGSTRAQTADAPAVNTNMPSELQQLHQQQQQPGTADVAGPTALDVAGLAAELRAQLEHGRQKQLEAQQQQEEGTQLPQACVWPGSAGPHPAQVSGREHSVDAQQAFSMEAPQAPEATADVAGLAVAGAHVGTHMPGMLSAAAPAAATTPLVASEPSAAAVCVCVGACGTPDATAGPLLQEHITAMPLPPAAAAAAAGPPPVPDVLFPLSADDLNSPFVAALRPRTSSTHTVAEAAAAVGAPSTPLTAAAAATPAAAAATATATDMCKPASPPGVALPPIAPLVMGSPAAAAAAAVAAALQPLNSADTPHHQDLQPLPSRLSGLGSLRLLLGAGSSGDHETQGGLLTGTNSWGRLLAELQLTAGDVYSNNQTQPLQQQQQQQQQAVQAAAGQCTAAPAVPSEVTSALGAAHAVLAAGGGVQSEQDLLQDVHTRSAPATGTPGNRSQLQLTSEVDQTSMTAAVDQVPPLVPALAPGVAVAALSPAAAPPAAPAPPSAGGPLTLLLRQQLLQQQGAAVQRVQKVAKEMLLSKLLVCCGRVLREMEVVPEAQPVLLPPSAAPASAAATPAPAEAEVATAAPSHPGRSVEAGASQSPFQTATVPAAAAATPVSHKQQQHQQQQAGAQQGSTSSGTSSWPPSVANAAAAAGSTSSAGSQGQSAAAAPPPAAAAAVDSSISNTAAAAVDHSQAGAAAAAECKPVSTDLQRRQVPAALGTALPAAAGFAARQALTEVMMKCALILDELDPQHQRAMPVQIHQQLLDPQHQRAMPVQIHQQLLLQDSHHVQQQRRQPGFLRQQQQQLFVRTRQISSQPALAAQQQHQHPILIAPYGVKGHVNRSVTHGVDTPKAVSRSHSAAAVTPGATTATYTPRPLLPPPPPLGSINRPAAAATDAAGQQQQHHTPSPTAGGSLSNKLLGQHDGYPEPLMEPPDDAAVPDTLPHHANMPQHQATPEGSLTVPAPVLQQQHQLGPARELPHPALPAQQQQQQQFSDSMPVFRRVVESGTVVQVQIPTQVVETAPPPSHQMQQQPQQVPLQCLLEPPAAAATAAPAAQLPAAALGEFESMLRDLFPSDEAAEAAAALIPPAGQLAGLVLPAVQQQQRGPALVPTPPGPQAFYPQWQQQLRAPPLVPLTAAGGQLGLPLATAAPYTQQQQQQVKPKQRVRRRNSRGQRRVSAGAAEREPAEDHAQQLVAALQQHMMMRDGGSSLNQAELQRHERLQRLIQEHNKQLRQQP